MIPDEGLLWAVRVVLLPRFVIHIVGVIQLAGRNRAARPAGYPAPRIQRSLVDADDADRRALLLAFVVFHILHFTTGTIDPSEFAEGAVYRQPLRGVPEPGRSSLIYVARRPLLGFHLRHAIWSSIQTAGWDKPNRNPTFRRISTRSRSPSRSASPSVPVAFWTESWGHRMSARPSTPASPTARSRTSGRTGSTTTASSARASAPTTP